MILEFFEESAAARMHKSTMSLLGLPGDCLPNHSGQTMRRWSVHEPVPAITLVGGYCLLVLTNCCCNNKSASIVVVTTNPHILLSRQVHHYCCCHSKSAHIVVTASFCRLLANHCRLLLSQQVLVDCCCHSKSLQIVFAIASPPGLMLSQQVLPDCCCHSMSLRPVVVTQVCRHTVCQVMDIKMYREISIGVSVCRCGLFCLPHTFAVSIVAE